MKERYKKADIIVAATSFERKFIRGELNRSSLMWSEDSKQDFIQVGTVDECPVNIVLTFARINGRKVVFFYPVSEVVDYRLIKKWFDENVDGMENKEIHEAECFKNSVEELWI